LASSRPASDARSVAGFDLHDAPGPVDVEDEPAAARQREDRRTASAGAGRSGQQRLVGYESDLVPAVADRQQGRRREDGEQLEEVLVSEVGLGLDADAEHPTLVI
jgi:hypothetical protein